MAGIYGLVKLLGKCQRLTRLCRTFWFVFLLGEGRGWGRIGCGRYGGLCLNRTRRLGGSWASRGPRASMGMMERCQRWPAIGPASQHRCLNDHLTQSAAGVVGACRRLASNPLEEVARSRALEDVAGVRGPDLSVNRGGGGSHNGKGQRKGCEAFAVGHGDVPVEDSLRVAGLHWLRREQDPAKL